MVVFGVVISIVVVVGVVLWMEEISHPFLGFQFIGQAAKSPHPLFNIGR